jgi:peptidoglycan glycosyltransferase
MMLRELASGVTSKDRNTEMVLLAGSAAFVFVAWRALDAAAFGLPANFERIVTQFLLSGAAGHIGLRIVAPRASGQLYAIALVLCAIGLMFVTRLAPAVAQDQANWITIGIVLMVVAAAAGRRYNLLRRYKYTAALVAVVILLATGVIGTTINGARLWITVAGQTVQTTEIIKVFIVVFLAGYMADEAGVLASPRISFAGRRYSALPYVIPLLLTLGLALGIIGLLRDLGQIVILILLTAAMLYVATGRRLYVALSAALLGIALVVGYYAFDHARVRIDVWLDPQAHADTTGYQTLQSMYAIQAGGVTGAGLAQGDPDAIPIVDTDYIFSAIAEELGLAGAFGVALLFGLLLFAGLRVALSAADDYGHLLAACIALLIAIQAAVIIAGNLRLIPTTGITLPFVSYGGSSLVVNFLLLGLLLGVSQRANR